MTRPLPHHDVWTRLGVSGIDGIGVFAIRPIPAGTPLFASDRAPIRWVIEKQLEGSRLTAAERRFYRDFAIRRGGKLGCPASFDLLTAGWYLNEPAAGEEPNVAVADDDTMSAVRDIAEGEELTVRYASFSEASGFGGASGPLSGGPG